MMKKLTFALVSAFVLIAFASCDKENERMLVPFSKNLKVGGQFFICTMNPLFIHNPAPLSPRQNSPLLPLH